MIRSYPLASSGDLLHSMTISHITIGQSPIDGFYIILVLPDNAKAKHVALNSSPINVLFRRNLKACFTVPSCLSCIIAVGKYDIKLNNSCKSCTCTKEPVKILQTVNLVMINDLLWNLYKTRAGISISIASKIPVIKLDK